MDERARIPPGLPRSNPTSSTWQQPRDEICDLRSSETLPAEADFVIVGSGISGACIAYNVLCRAPKSKVVMLEARQACSGATGRNGGHTKAASYRTFPHNVSSNGLSEAVRIARLEYANIKATQSFAREHNISCELRAVDTVDVVLDQTAFESGTIAIAQLQDALSPEDEAAKYRVYDSTEAKEKFFVDDAVGAFEYEAGSINAYSFTIGVLKLALKCGLNLQTSTPATKVEPLRARDVDPRNPQDTEPTWDRTPKWTVHTPRGLISTPIVILATNAYTAHLVEVFQGSIVPFRGQMTAQRPGSRLQKLNLLTTYSFIYRNGFDYMVTRPSESPHPGDVVIGGGLGRLGDDYIAEFGETNDGSLNAALSRYLRECTVQHFGENWGDDDPDGRVRDEWTGIMGATADEKPFVGEVPGMPGLWVCAGFNGHGMVLCLKCAEAMVEMMIINVAEEGDQKEPRAPDWFPQSFLISEERLATPFVGFTDLAEHN